MHPFPVGNLSRLKWLQIIHCHFVTIRFSSFQNAKRVKRSTRNTGHPGPWCLRESLGNVLQISSKLSSTAPRDWTIQLYLHDYAFHGVSHDMLLMSVMLKKVLQECSLKFGRFVHSCGKRLSKSVTFASQNLVANEPTHFPLMEKHNDNTWFQAMAAGADLWQQLQGKLSPAHHIAPCDWPIIHYLQQTTGMVSSEATAMVSTCH